MAKLKLLSTIFSKLGSLTKNNGQIIVTRDSKSLYVDLEGERIEITDWIDIDTEESLLAILTPLTNKYYYTKDTNKIWRYVNGKWECLNTSVNDLTPTYTESSTLAKLSSGEKLSVSFGKISKAITDLISHIGDSVKHITSTERTNWGSAYTHSQSAHARTDATKVEKSSTNGNIKINGTETTVYTHPSGTNPHGTTKSDVGLGNVGNFKAVSTVASQGLTDTEKSNARANIGAGTSSFSGSYNDLSNKPTIPTVGNGTVTIKQAGTSKGTFTMNQSGNTTIELTDTNTWRPLGTTADTACAGNDARLSNSRPASDVYAWAKASSKPSYSWSEITSKPSSFTPVNHTHNYAGSNSAGGNALTLQLSREGNDANWLPSSSSTTQMRELSNSSSNIPYSQWWQILANRSADINYGSQLAMGMTTNDLYFRNYSAGSWGSWRKVIFSDDTISKANYATSAGNADTLDGNHASAFATASHTHNYLPLSGGTMGGSIKFQASSLPQKDLEFICGIDAFINGGEMGWQSKDDFLSNCSKVNHTHNYAGSSSAGGSANSLSYFKNTSTTDVGIDDTSANAVGYVNGTSSILNQNDGAMYKQVYSGSWVHEIYGDYRTGQIAVRGKNNGTWQAWRKVLDSSNYKTYCTPANIGAAASSHTHSYAGSSSSGGSATSAVKLDSSAGSATQPVYFSGGKPVACTYTLGKSVPSNAVFTDTNTWRGIQNNLTSDSTTDSLSAAQGKVLKGLVDGKAASMISYCSSTSSTGVSKTVTIKGNFYNYGTSWYIQDLVRFTFYKVKLKSTSSYGSGVYSYCEYKSSSNDIWLGASGETELVGISTSINDQTSSNGVVERTITLKLTLGSYGWFNIEYNSSKYKVTIV